MGAKGALLCTPVKPLGASYRRTGAVRPCAGTYVDTLQTSENTSPFIGGDQMHWGTDSATLGGESITPDGARPTSVG